MVVTITSCSTKAEIEAALQKLQQGRKKTSTAPGEQTSFDARKYCGVITLKQDPLKLQKKWRDEWE